MPSYNIPKCPFLIPNRFEFGIPLEDIFPINDIHQKLKHIFIEALRIKHISGQTIETILRNSRGTIDECFKLKEQITKSGSHHLQCYSAVSYFWIIRHFLGLLPLPLLPLYAKERRFKWKEIATECKLYLKGKQNIESLNDTIANEICSLPFANFLLLQVLMQFFINSCIEGDIFNTLSAYYVTEYYSGALFVRPFRPGNIINTDERLYFALLYYMIIKWKNIADKCISINYCERKKYLIKKYVSDSSTQTPPQYFPEPLIIYKTAICDSITFKDVSCQTPMEVQSNDEDIKISVRDKSTKCRCTNGIQYEEIVENKQTFSTFQTPKKNNKQIQTCNSIQVHSCNSGRVQTCDPILPKKDLTVERLESTTNTSLNRGWSDIVQNTAEKVKRIEEYMYDDYDTFKQEDFNQITKPKYNPFSGSNIFRNLFSENELDTPKSNMFSKISKIGWTYTPSESSTTPTAKIGKPKLNYHQLCFNDEDTKIDTIKLDDKDQKSEGEKSETCSIKSRKSIISFKKLKVPFNLLKKISSRKKFDVPGIDNLSCNVKYRKLSPSELNGCY